MLAVPMYVRFPLSLRNGEDLLFERGIVGSENIMSLPAFDIALEWREPLRPDCR